MLLDNRWVFKVSANADFVFIDATAQNSDVIDLKAAGFFDGGGECFLLCRRKHGATYTKNALTNVRFSFESCDTEGGTYLEHVGVDVPVATINAGYELAKIALGPNVQRYIRVTITPTGAPTTVTLNARLATS